MASQVLPDPFNVSLVRERGIEWEAHKVTANPSPFIQHKVNFVGNMLYDKSAPAEEYPIVWSPGAPISRIPRGSYPRRRKNIEERQNIAYEGTRDLNVAYKRIPDHHFT